MNLSEPPKTSRELTRSPARDLPRPLKTSQDLSRPLKTSRDLPPETSRDPSRPLNTFRRPSEDLATGVPHFRDTRPRRPVASRRAPLSRLRSSPRDSRVLHFHGLSPTSSESAGRGASGGVPHFRDTRSPLPLAHCAPGARRPSQDRRGTSRRPSEEDCETFRKPSEDLPKTCQRLSENLPEIFRKSCGRSPATFRRP